MSALPFRIGHGYDVHKLVPERKLFLGGVDIPHTTGLLGHSDADVLLHAIMDALLGALALSDIGTHFPDNDNSYKNIDSTMLLQKVLALPEFSPWMIGNLDVTIVAQKPKMMPHIPAMKLRLAEAMQVDVSRVSIKAKTEEKLGFTGREEGISAYATVLIEKD